MQYTRPAATAPLEQRRRQRHAMCHRRSANGGTARGTAGTARSSTRLLGGASKLQQSRQAGKLLLTCSMMIILPLASMALAGAATAAVCCSAAAGAGAAAAGAAAAGCSVLLLLLAAAGDGGGTASQLISSWAARYRLPAESPCCVRPRSAPTNRARSTVAAPLPCALPCNVVAGRPPGGSQRFVARARPSGSAQGHPAKLTHTCGRRLRLLAAPESRLNGPTRGQARPARAHAAGAARGHPGGGPHCAAAQGRLHRASSGCAGVSEQAAMCPSSSQAAFNVPRFLLPRTPATSRQRM